MEAYKVFCFVFFLYLFPIIIQESKTILENISSWKLILVSSSLSMLRGGKYLHRLMYKQGLCVTAESWKEPEMGLTERVLR